MPSLADLDAELRNWGRWAVDPDAHRLDCSISSIRRFWLPSKHRDEGWGDASAPDAIPDPVDELAAEAIDRQLKRLASNHWHVRWEDVRRGLSRRQLRYGTNTAVLVLVVLGILGALNYLAQRHTQRFDLTKDQRYSLSDQTKKVLAGLKDEVKITYFQRQRDMARGEDRLKEFTALSPRLKVEYVDPVQSPAKAQAADVRGP